MTQILSEVEVLEMLRQQVTFRQNQSQLAAQIGISPAMLNAVLHGKKAPGGAIEKFLGVERISVYRRVDAA